VPVSPTYPGVYINELPSAVHTIVGVPTSVAAFVGSAARGPTDDPVQVNSFSDYEATFGPLDSAVPLSYAVHMFFLNGGTTGLVVRVGDSTAVTADLVLTPDIKLAASSPGSWANDLTATVDTANLLDKKVNAFNLTLQDGSGISETYLGVSLQPGPLYLKTLLASSALVKPDEANTYNTVPKAQTYGIAPPPAPAVAGGAKAGGGAPPTAPVPATPTIVTDGSIRGADGTGPPTLGEEGPKSGMFALKKADIFNILCLPVDPRTPGRRRPSRRPPSSARSSGPCSSSTPRAPGGPARCR
jgi:hypothetical protein